MAHRSTLSQASFAAMVLISTILTYTALSPPNIIAKEAPATGDTARALYLTHQHTSKIIMIPLGAAAIHTACLALIYPRLSSKMVGFGLKNGINTRLLRWSPSSLIPMALLLGAGVPLRRVSYATLGYNITFILTQPDQLTTTGIYSYVQHPSYAGLAIVIVCNVALLWRMDGALSCWFPPKAYSICRVAYWVVLPISLSMVALAIWTRVRQEERMLRSEFGFEWEEWHARTARFVPWVL
jgi:protein-S-isoprenylcysteine O-methyltransferase Ste14